MQSNNSLSIDSLIPLLERRVTDARERGKELESRLEDIQEELEHVKAEISDYQRALAREQKKVGIQPVIPTTENVEAGDADKGKLFEEFAIRRGLKGFSIPVIFALYKERGMEVGKNYPYYLVSTRYGNTLKKIGNGRNRTYRWTVTASE